MERSECFEFTMTLIHTLFLFLYDESIVSNVEGVLLNVVAVAIVM